MTLEERVKALETKLSGTGWSIEGVAESDNFSPNPMALLSKRIEILEKTIADLKEAAPGKTADTDKNCTLLSGTVIGEKYYGELIKPLD